MDGFFSLQPQCLKTTFFKREVTLKVSKIYGEVLLLLTPFRFSCKVKLIIVIIITIIVFPIVIMLIKGTYKTVCHRTSVNVICYMVQ